MDFMPRNVRSPSCLLSECEDVDTLLALTNLNITSKIELDRIIRAGERLSTSICVRACVCCYHVTACLCCLYVVCFTASDDDDGP